MSTVETLMRESWIEARQVESHICGHELWRDGLRDCPGCCEEEDLTELYDNRDLCGLCGVREPQRGHTACRECAA